jgi:DNA-binding SARP family transcriptional activator
MKFRVLGSLEVLVDQGDATPTAPKLRQALALLLLKHNSVVPLYHLIDELWGEDPPRRATRTVQTYIYQLRRGLEPFTRPSDLVLTRPNGYLAKVPPEQLDLVVFEDLVARGGQALADEDTETGRYLLSEALRLWRGRPLCNVSCGRPLQAFASRLEESFLRVLELRIDADFRLSRHRELVGELKELAAQHVFHEGLHGKLLLALYRSGRRNEALGVYRQLAARLAEELGLEPGPEIQRLHQRALVADPSLDPPLVHRGTPGPVPRPAQLPPDISDYVHREEQDELIWAALDRREAYPVAVPILSLTGMAGSGKSTAAVHAAHRLREEYPDGQFYSDLRGTRGVPEDWGEVLTMFLRSTGCSPPERLDERIAAFRTWTADRSVLVVLDDADRVEQVVPLLPGGKGCAVIVTSRGPLYGMPSITPVKLGPFGVAQGVALLRGIIGTDRVATEPEAAAGLVRAVGGLPLAIRFLGQRLAPVRRMHLGQILRQLTDGPSRCRLADLGPVGLDLYDRLEGSYRKLNPHAQEGFRRLAVLRHDEFTGAQAAAVFGADEDATELILLHLADAQLLQVLGDDGADQCRYAMHELVRPYTLECAQSTDRSPVGTGPGSGHHGGDAARIAEGGRAELCLGYLHT